MKKISISLPFGSNPDQTSKAARKIICESYKAFIGHETTKEDETRFEQRVNPGNLSITDHYFDGKKIGSLAITYILDIPREIRVDFIPAR